MYDHGATTKNTPIVRNAKYVAWLRQHSLGVVTIQTKKKITGNPIATGLTIIAAANMIPRANATKYFHLSANRYDSKNKNTLKKKKTKKGISL